jgi:hypothetical protein
MDTFELLKQKDVEKIATEGWAIYERNKDQYEPKHNGKLLAIDTETGKVYMGDSSAEAVGKALQEHPDTIFYIIRIGSDFVEKMARAQAAAM